MAISVTGLTAHTQVGTGTWTDYAGGPASGSTTATFLSGSSARGRKFTGFKGFAYEVNAAGTDLSNSIILVRVLVNGGIGATLAADGIRIRLEDTSANISDWTVGGSDTYKGGWVEFVIDTANAETLNSGTAASLTAIQYVGIYLNAAASSGGDPNVYVDEVLSMPNTGLTLAGNTTQLFDEAATWDEISLYGVITKRGSVVYSKCPLILSPDASGHVSVDEVIEFEEPIYEDGTNIDSALTLQGLSSADADTITLTRLTALCEDNGDITGTNADKKLDFASATDIVADTCTLRGFDGTTVALGGSGNSYTTCTFQGCTQITDSGAVVRGGFVRNSVCGADEGALLWTTSSDWEDTEFIMGATNRHALEGTGTFSDTLNGFTFTGYATSGQPGSVGNEVFHNSGSGTITLTGAGISGFFSYRNSGGGSTSFTQTVAGTFAGMKDNTEVRIYAAGTSTELDGIETATAGSPGNRSFVASIEAATSVDYVIINNEYEQINVFAFSWPSDPFTINVQQRFDRNYRNP